MHKGKSEGAASHTPAYGSAPAIYTNKHGKFYNKFNLQYYDIHIHVFRLPSSRLHSLRKMSQNSNHYVPHTETMEIIEKFKTLQSSTMESLQSRKVSLQSLPKLSDADATEYILNHGSFFNFYLIEQVIHSHGTEKDKENLFKYKEQFTEYGKHGIPLDYHLSDCLCPFKSDCLINLFIIFTPEKQLNIGDLHTFFDEFRTMLNIGPSLIFNLRQVEVINPGSLKLTILISLPEMQEKFPLSTEQEEIMTTMGVNHLWFIYQFNKDKNQVLLFICIQEIYCSVH